MQKSPTAIITGASSGIGYALALVLAREGYDLGLTARRKELLESLTEEIEKKYPGRRVFQVPADVCRQESLETALNALYRQLGRVDLFIANAGVGVATPAWKNNWKEVRWILETNILGAIHSLEIAKKWMLEQKSGHLVGLSSIATVRGFPGSSAYCSSKAALTTYLESIRLDLKKLGIKVSSIHPGFIDTPMTEKNPYMMPFLLPADKAAEKIYKSIRSGRARYYFPWQMSLLVWLLKHFPDRVYDFLMSLRKDKSVFGK